MKNSNISPELMAKYKAVIPRAFGLTGTQSRMRIFWIIAFSAFTLFTFIWFDFNPIRMIEGLDKLGWLLPNMFPPSPNEWLPDFLWGMGETLAIAFIGTTLGFVLAVPLSFLAAKNVVKNNFIRGFFRRSFDLVRGISTLIWAPMFIHVVGLGPFAGILAFLVSDMATLGKLFSEAIENIDQNQIDGVKSTGANPIQVIRYGYLPQILPIFLSNGLYFFESNVRQASILGVLGAGGIGMQLYDRIRVNNWDEVAFIIIMILVTVAVIDFFSKRLRERIIANPDYRQ
jgi:phosphonate transport system permease protein